MHTNCVVNVPTRLCYLGTVLHTRSDGFASSRNPLQIGAELFGHAGAESDVEVLCLMMETLKRTGINDLYLDLGHVGIYRGLARQAGLDEAGEQALFECACNVRLCQKSIPLLEELEVQEPAASMLASLAELNGDDAIKRAKTVLAKAGQEVQDAVELP